MGSEIEGRETPSEEGRSRGATSEEAFERSAAERRSFERRSSGVGSRSEGGSLLSIERKVMSSRALGEAPRSLRRGAEPSARERLRVLFVRGVLQGNLAPRGRGGGQRAVRPSSPRSLRRGEDGRARVGGGWGRGSDRCILLLCAWYCRVLKPPEGGEGGNELSGRSCPGACVGARADGREWGEGGGEEYYLPFQVFLSQ